MQIVDGNNNKYTARVAGEERLEVWIPPAGYIRPTGYEYVSVRFLSSKNIEEKENLLPDHLFKIEE